MNDKCPEWLQHVEEVLDAHVANKLQLWVSFNYDTGYTGTVQKISEHVYAVLQKKGGLYHFCSRDVATLFDPNVKSDQKLIEDPLKGVKN